ncbi:hypothetical protein [Streptomyces sp. URMC 123]|uniref:hypothetical protein n=1 Tax=Streptomyces sp. URMC 123 TaxID=3423403 RepID=UPI003F1AC138
MSALLAACAAANAVSTPPASQEAATRAPRGPQGPRGQGAASGPGPRGATRDDGRSTGRGGARRDAA